MAWKAGAIFLKTPQGTQALANRQSALAPRLRPILILIDGKRTFAELSRMCTGMGDPQQLLQLLVDEGYAQAPAGGAVKPHPPVASDSAATELIQRVPLREAQRWAVRRLTDLMGPGAETVCLRIESTRNAAEFESTVRKAQEVLRQACGSEPAARFNAELQQHLPA